ncbi:GAF domain-containing protein [Streptomyces sp. BH055]|uniref:GAF domain-containing protein n=1 Tax=Streptomyces sp. BH055 TaxID=3401173 RepID=UPI003BB60986
MLEEVPSLVHDVSIAAAVGRRSLPVRLCAAFTRSLGAQHAAVSLLPRLEHWQLLHATDETALQTEADQFTHAGGPSVSAALEMRPVCTTAARHAVRPAGTPGPAGVPFGVRQVLAVPLCARRTPIGVISLHYSHPVPLSDDDIALATEAAELAREELLRWRPVHTGPPRGGTRWTNDSRAARWQRIHQAAGFVAARDDRPVHEALAYLQETSRRGQHSLLDVCDRILQPPHTAQNPPHTAARRPKTVRRASDVPAHAR